MKSEIVVWGEMKRSDDGVVVVLLLLNVTVCL